MVAFVDGKRRWVCSGCQRMAENDLAQEEEEGEELRAREREVDREEPPV